MDGTCIETPPQFVSEDEDPVVFSFFSDLERSPDVARLTLTVTRAIEKTFGRVNKQLDQYRRYDQLWKVDKAQHLSKFEQRNPTTVMFDSRLQSFSKAVQDARAMPHELEVDFMAISVGSLLRDIQEHAKAWVVAITKLMNTMCRQELMDLHELIGEFSANLDRNPDTLDDLKFILNMVAEIGGRSMEMELQYAALEDKYRTLRMYEYA
eukprot:scaffold76500_cov69-Phaeocystis_antarctica.AAC.1